MRVEHVERDGNNSILSGEDSEKREDEDEDEDDDECGKRRGLRRRSRSSWTSVYGSERRRICGFNWRGIER